MDARGGLFNLVYGGNRTQDLAWDASAAQVESALSACCPWPASP